MKAMMKIMIAMIFSVAASALFAAPRVSKGVPSGWLEDYEKAKRQAAKEGKYILLCTCASDDRYAQRDRRPFYEAKFS
jgi:hypothetical protein